VKAIAANNLSGASFPVQSVPSWLRYILYIGPLTYGVDGLRGTLIGVSAFPLWLDFAVLLISCLALATLGSYFLSKMEAD
jgi:ABC-2 type transport system permease protein